MAFPIAAGRQQLVQLINVQENKSADYTAQTLPSKWQVREVTKDQGFFLGVRLPYACFNRQRQWRKVNLRAQSRLEQRSAATASTSNGDSRESQQANVATTFVSSGVASWQWTPEADGDLEKPAWQGTDPISRFVNALISFKPVFSVMKLGARQMFIETAQKAGIPWRERAAKLRGTPEVYEEKERLENKDLVYPSYYLQEFHAYEKGNLCWEAAFEAESATLSMCLRTFPEISSAHMAADVLRAGWLEAIQKHHLAHAGGRPIRDILDVGCSVGVSTFYLADAFPDADVTGLDLSPYFLAVASYRAKQAEREGQGRQRPIRWLHALGEDCGLPSASVDLVSLAYTCHECPADATRALLREAHRVLRPGGTVAMTDNSPKSRIIQKLPAPVATLMKATEPWTDDYFGLDFEQAAREAGFRVTSSVLTDPRHRTFTATA